MTTRVAAGTFEDDAQLRPFAALAYTIYKRVISPILHAIAPSGCRYVPTCSEYAYVSFLRFGVTRGAWLSLRRLLRCHPWGKGGLDPVPERTCPIRKHPLG